MVGWLLSDEWEKVSEEICRFLLYVLHEIGTHHFRITSLERQCFSKQQEMLRTVHSACAML
jgi:hypothetical protein